MRIICKIIKWFLEGNLIYFKGKIIPNEPYLCRAQLRSGKALFFFFAKCSLLHVCGDDVLHR